MSGSEFRPAAPGFEAFFMSYDPRVRRYLFARGARNEVLKEAADAAMEEALRYWDRLRHHPNPQAWLFKVAAQRHAKSYKEHLRQEKLTDPGDFDRLVDHDTGISCEDRLDLLRRLRELPEQQREALVMFWLLDMPYEQIAEVMGVQASTARAHAARARARLAQMYADEEGGCT
ncbi:RNA polymerase sigma factor [Streptomyces phaeochromogenes]|uniref:RNA polymerase sigma factor n=1 Tax=Streptomyces phaeochromogenes TaxID=1923 RepID=UPI00386698F7|nr:sigma-70 family RNA polymerase sigma factor [Streptomyces phaeochromogenes]